MGRYEDCADGRWGCLWCGESRNLCDCHGAPASNLAYEMRKAGVSPKKLAQESGIPVSRIVRLMAGKQLVNGMNAEAFMAIVRVIGCDPELLLEDDPARRY